MLLRVALVRTDFSEELSASFIRVTRIGELGKTFLRSVRRLLVTASVVPSSPILIALMKDGLSSSEMSVLTRPTWRNVPEDTVLHSYRRENFKSYIVSHSAHGFLWTSDTNEHRENLHLFPIYLQHNMKISVYLCLSEHNTITDWRYSSTDITNWRWREA
jgi:hypothetical protein